MLYQLSYRLDVLFTALPGRARIRQVSIGIANAPAAIIRTSLTRANVAELADALDLGSSARKGMGVRPSPFAPPYRIIVFSTAVLSFSSLTRTAITCSPGVRVFSVSV